MFFDRIRGQSPLCIGIDPSFTMMPKFMGEYLAKHGSAALLRRFSEVLCGVAKEVKSPAVKIQMAFFEAQGADGFRAMQDVVKCAKELGLSVLIDGKRGDIASTMFAYGQGAFDILNADAITVMPYMGTDSFEALLPWIKAGKAVYSVCLPSNPSARIYLEDEHAQAYAQNLATSIYHMFARDRLQNRLGFVIGASRLSWWKNKRLDICEAPMLLPGLGAQGATLSDTDKQYLKDRAFDLLPVSRSISGFGEKHYDVGLDGIHDWDHYQAWCTQKGTELSAQI
jgi:orotidine-5'-phosphate decarboxylase